VPSGSSGIPYAPTNGTWPSPTITVQPINAGSKIVGKGSTAAIVVALAVAFDLPWLPLALCLDVVTAQGIHEKGGSAYTTFRTNALSDASLQETLEEKGM
jgi:hypothetical protein